jgi:hypothetical protein
LIGIVVGHWNDATKDPGAVCPDGLTEFQVNQDIATRVEQNLVEQGFDVDLLREFDDRLAGYRALALISIHADSCDYKMISYFQSSGDPGKSLPGAFEPLDLLFAGSLRQGHGYDLPRQHGH